MKETDKKGDENYPIDQEHVEEMEDVRIQLVSPDRSFLVDTPDTVQLSDLDIRIKIGNQEAQISIKDFSAHELMGIFIQSDKIQPKDVDDPELKELIFGMIEGK